MLVRSCLVAALCLLGCSGSGEQALFGPLDPPAATAGTGGVAVSGGRGGDDGPPVAGSTTDQGGKAGSGPAAGAAGAESLGGTGGTNSATGGQAGGATTAGAPGAGGGAAGTGGTAHAGGGGQSSGGHAGTGGQASDPLEPTPVPGCPGYVKIFVPQGTCVWLHGTFTHQTESCSLTNPATGKCGTASAPDMDTSTIVSVSAIIDRFDLDQGLCPKLCN